MLVHPFYEIYNDNNKIVSLLLIHKDRLLNLLLRI